MDPFNPILVSIQQVCTQQFGDTKHYFQLVDTIKERRPFFVTNANIGLKMVKNSFKWMELTPTGWHIYKKTDKIYFEPQRGDTIYV